jgi:hypothetical protein
VDNHVLGQLMRELGIERRDMGAKVFVHYRESFGEHTTFLRLKVLVPVCPDCWMTDPRMSYQVPNISSESWDVDLLLLGFHPQTIEKLKTDIMEGVESERGPWCFICGEWIPWWEKEGGCYTKEVEFAEYFGLVEKENPSISKSMRKRIVGMYGRKCFACGRALSKDEITVDHIVARSLGGSGDQVNLQVLCERCNGSKGDIVAVDKEAVLHFPMRPVPSEAYEDVTW